MITLKSLLFVIGVGALFFTKGNREYFIPEDTNDDYEFEFEEEPIREKTVLIKKDGVIIGRERVHIRQ